MEPGLLSWLIRSTRRKHTGLEGRPWQGGILVALGSLESGLGFLSNTAPCLTMSLQETTLWGPHGESRLKGRFTVCC